MNAVETPSQEQAPIDAVELTFLTEYLEQPLFVDLTSLEVDNLSLGSPLKSLQALAQGRAWMYSRTDLAREKLRAISQKPWGEVTEAEKAEVEQIRSFYTHPDVIEQAKRQLSAEQKAIVENIKQLEMDQRSRAFLVISFGMIGVITYSQLLAVEKLKPFLNPDGLPHLIKAVAELTRLYGSQVGLIALFVMIGMMRFRPHPIAQKIQKATEEENALNRFLETLHP